MTVEAGGQLTASTLLTSLTAGAANTKGSWVELIASTANANEWIGISINNGTSDETFLIDIAIGGVGSEVVVISNIQFWSNVQSADYIYLPLTIASGARVSARCQATGAASACQVAVHLHTGDEFGTSASNVTIGDDTANSKGTVVDPGGTADTKGSWAELVASLSADVDWLVIKFSGNDNDNDAATRYHVDIGTGVAASEVVLIPDIFWRKDVSERHTQKSFMFREAIASGARVAARCQSQITDATDRLMDVSIIGCNMVAP